VGEGGGAGHKKLNAAHSLILFAESEPSWG